LELLAVIQFYSASKRNNDSPRFQAMVYFAFVVDTVCTVANYADVYLVCN